MHIEIDSKQIFIILLVLWIATVFFVIYATRWARVSERITIVVFVLLLPLALPLSFYFFQFFSSSWLRYMQ